ncbi:MAG: hypothetical protein KJ589_01305 [Proteobacteria bacterium]|nr:hypothetical protein [Pseudomonadota bacterium]
MSNELPPDTDDDWGEDWETAFQLDDPSLPEEEEQFTIPPQESWASANHDQLRPPPEPIRTKGRLPVSPPKSNGPTPTFVRPPRTGKINLPGFRFLAGILVIVIVILLGMITILKKPPQQATLIPTQPTATPSRQGTPPPPELPMKETIKPDQPVVVSLKWHHKDFFIPVAEQNAPAPSAFLKVELSLFIQQKQNQGLPSDRDPFIRDLIYQFYNNRPPQELRRFALARGEMATILKFWILKQWPDLPLESIVFNHYEII